MKKVLLIILISYLNVTGQIRITFQNHIVGNNGDIIVNVFAQNLGSGININSICANSMYVGLKNQYQLHFYLTYVDLMNNSDVIEILPSSILIKTVFDTMIPMEEPHYYFPSTGSSRGQEWEVNFINVPSDAANVSVFVLGEQLNLGDMEGTSLTRTRKEQELSDAISMGIKSNKLEDWENALKWWEIAIGRDSETISTYSKEISVAMCEKAELFYEKKQFIEAINLFEKAKETNKNIFDDYGENYSNLLFSYGVKQIDDSEFETGLVSLNYSCFLSDVNRPKIENKLNSLKRSWALSTSLSIIPGLSQTIYQKGKTKPAILFTTFSLSSLVGIYNSISADYYYRDYLNSDTPDDAETNFYKAEERLKTSKIYFGVAIATIIYSVIDQFIDTSNYNSFFEISDSYSTAFQTTDNFSVSLNIRF